MAKPKKDIWENFGYNLGFGAKPWIQRYGKAWQYELAKAIVRGETERKYEDYYYATHDGHFSRPAGTLKVPKASNAFKEDAERYILQANEFHYRYVFLQQQEWMTLEEAISRHIPAEQEKFNLKIIYGRRKILDERGQAVVDAFKGKLVTLTDPKQIKNMQKTIKKIEDQLKRPMWEIAYEQAHAYDIETPPPGKKRFKDIAGKGGKGGKGAYSYIDDDGSGDDLDDEDYDDDDMHEDEEGLADTAMQKLEDLRDGKFESDFDDFLTETERKRLIALGLYDDYLEQYQIKKDSLSEYIRTTHNMREDIYTMITTNNVVRERLEDVVGADVVDRALRRAMRRRKIPVPVYDPKMSTKKALEQRIIKSKKEKMLERQKKTGK